MIRIDLSKDGDSKTSGGGAVPKELHDLAGKLKVPPQILDLFSDAKRLSVIAIGTAIAMLPHLFFSQFRSYVVNDHQKQMQKLKDNLDAVNVEIGKYSAFEKELESYEQQKKLVNERLQGIRALLEARGTPVNVLDAVGQSLPQKAWLEKISYDFKPDLSQVKFEGTAYSNEEISDFLDKLSESIYLQDVKLSEVGQRTDTNKLVVKTFKISTLPKARFPAVVIAKEPVRSLTTPQGAPAAPRKSLFKRNR